MLLAIVLLACNVLFGHKMPVGNSAPDAEGISEPQREKIGAPQAASVLFGQFETVFYAKAEFLSNSGTPNRWGKASEDYLVAPFNELMEGIKHVGSDDSSEILRNSEAILVGAKEFRPPAGFGAVQSRRCYIVIPKDGNYDLRKYFRHATDESSGGLQVWKWSAQFGEYGEDDPKRSSTFYASQIASSYLVIANNRDDLQETVSRLAAANDSKAMLARVPDWDTVSEHKFWGYRRLGDSRVLNTEAEGMSLLTINAKTIILFVDSDDKQCVILIVSSDMGRNSALTEKAASILPPFKHLGGGLWEAMLPFAENEEGHDRLFVVLNLFGFGEYT